MGSKALTIGQGEQPIDVVLAFPTAAMEKYRARSP
jgi:hypothetical protein